MRQFRPSRPRRVRFGALALTPLVLGACASFPSLGAKTQKPPSLDEMIADGSSAPRANPIPTPHKATPFTLPALAAAPAHAAYPPATTAEIAALVPDTPIDVSLPPQPLPQFLDTVFGELLHLPYALGPEIGARKDVITLRSAPQMPRRAFFALVQNALRDYDLVVAIHDGAVSVQESGGLPSGASVILRNHSSADTPESSRTVVQIVQLYAVDARPTQALVQDLFPASRALKITPTDLGNYLTIVGPGRDVAAAVSMIAELDQPRFAGAQVVRLEPTYSPAESFAKALSDALTTEGFQVSNQPLAPRGIMILPLTGTNQVLAFAGDPAVMARVQFWAAELDKPSIIGDKTSSFVYTVQNTDAASLGSLARGQAPTPFSPSSPTGVPTTTSSLTANGVSQTPSAVAATAPTVPGGSGQIPGGGSIVVDTMGNRILFTGTATQFAQLRNLLQQLDVPPRQVLIEVTVAEVTLTDSTTAGLQWFFSHSANNGGQIVQGGTQTASGASGVDLASKGVTLSYLNTTLAGLGTLQATFNAYASNNNVNIISRPRIISKSGGEAQLQVGTDIPILSSQAAASGIQTTTGATQVLQTVQYRQTGVILKVKPTVYGDNRVDVEISQEVSNSLPSSSGSISSPQIQNRSLSTELSLVDGATAVLGGLISNSYTKENEGVPFLKDLPILGSAFRTDNLGGTRDELVVLITPHIVRDSDEMTAVAEAMTGEVNRAFKVGTGFSYTLSPFVTGYNLGPGPSPHPDALDLGRVIDRARSRSLPPASAPRSGATPDDRSSTSPAADPPHP